MVLIGARVSAHTGKVLELGGWFYLLFKRYVCLTCKAKGKHPYTFQGCDPRLMELFPEALAAELPIVVGRKSAIRRNLHGLAVCLLSEGLAMKALRRSLKDVGRQEFYHKALGFTDYAIREREGGHVLGCSKSGFVEEFGEFDEGYGGIDVSLSFIRALFIKELAKRRPGTAKR